MYNKCLYNRVKLITKHGTVYALYIVDDVDGLKDE